MQYLHRGRVPKVLEFFFFVFFSLVTAAHHYLCLVAEKSAAGKAARSSVVSFLVHSHALPATDLDHFRYFPVEIGNNITSRQQGGYRYGYLRVILLFIMHRRFMWGGHGTIQSSILLYSLRGSNQISTQVIKKNTYVPSFEQYCCLQQTRTR